MNAIEEEMSDDDLCERWLGRDWPEMMNRSDAIELALACQEQEDAGDERDYFYILADQLK